MNKEQCVGEYTQSNPECKECGIKSTCIRKKNKIINGALKTWKEVQDKRFNLKKLHKEQREHQSLVRKLGQEIGEEQKRLEKSLDEYNRYMIYQKV